MNDICQQQAIDFSVALKDPALVREGCFIGGRWIGSDEKVAVTNPADQRTIASVPRLGRAATREALEGAREAQRPWAALPAKSRGAILRKWFDLIIANADDLAFIMTAEQGKTLAESRGEVLYGASFIEFFAEEARRVHGEVIPSPWVGSRIVVLRQPVGVVAAITPWNFPIAMITRKAGPALAAGCAMVCKPASETPLSALALAVLAERAGVPAGVFSVITGSSREIGAEMTSSPLVDALTFTGSTEVGRQLAEQCAGTIKRVGLELGGNAPFVVFEDADIDAAVQGAIASKFRNAGQTCVCTNRILVQQSIRDEFEQKFTIAVQNLRLGNGLDPDVTTGPLINEAAVRKVEQHIADAVQKGARILTGGTSPGGCYFAPTVLSGVTPKMAIAREETFGPVAPVFAFSTEAEAIALANDTEFGLASYLYTRDLGRAWRVAEALEYGMVGVNEGIISTAEAPFGGVKQSGIGREGSHLGMDEYLDVKYVLMGGLAG